MGAEVRRKDEGRGGGERQMDANEMDQGRNDDRAYPTRNGRGLLVSST